MKLAEKIIVALDFDSTEIAMAMIDQIGTELKYVKVGMELYYSSGPELIQEIKNRNLKVFLDLKLHDIPTTVNKALLRLDSLGVDMVNIHAAGGFNMMKAARDAISSTTKLIAVTQLTSTTADMLHHELLIKKDMAEVVVSYAKLAQKAGINGVVASAIEVPLIHKSCGDDFLTVTPGIRPINSSQNDQQRAMTPAQAIANGSDYMVIGRPITQADSPAEAFNRILEEITNA